MREPIALRPASRLLAGVVLLAMAGTLGGCGSLSMPSWDPTDLMDFLDTEKRTPGERKPVFPEGVPGISQGVPKEMIRGSAQSRADDEARAAAMAAPVQAQPAPPVEAQPAPPPPRRSRTAARRPPAQAPVEIAPDDVNVEDNPRAPPRRQTQWPQPATQPQANPFPAPLPR